MLRFFVLLLLFANGAYFVWSQGHLASIGLAPVVQSEPLRMQSQIKPDAIRLLNATEAKRVETLAAAPAPKPPECLQTALLSDTQASAVRDILTSGPANLPTSAWSLDNANEPARWIVYMGKYANAEAVAKKKSELRELSISFESLKNATLEPGLSLGTHTSQAKAQEAMAQMAKRGVRTGKVLQEFPERQGQILKLPVVDDALRAQLDPIKALLGANALLACKA